MSRQPIDVKGMMDLDPIIVDHLAKFLQEKEKRVAEQLLSALLPIVEGQQKDLTEPKTSSEGLSLEDGIEEFAERVRTSSKAPQLDFRNSPSTDREVQIVNSLLWELTETLEGSVVELFQRVRQIPIDQWQIPLFQVVHSVKELLLHSIEGLSHAINRLEKLMQEFSHSSVSWGKKSWFASIFSTFSFLDSHLFRNLAQTKKFLISQYRSFERRYQKYLQLSIKVEESLHGLKNRPIFSSLENSDQTLYRGSFRLLKMTEFGAAEKKGISADLSRALRQLASADSILLVFSTYNEKLKKAFIKTTMEWKCINRQNENFQNVLQSIQGKILDCQQEMRELMQTMQRYRTFLLKNDPNPYVRSRWGFTEWIVGPEPSRAKKLLNMIFSAQELNQWLVQFRETLSSTPQEVEDRAILIRKDIEDYLHDMGQPLISLPMMKNRAGYLLESLKECDEAGSPGLSTISYFEEVLSKAMREDWQYHVLHGFPLFHEIYRLHQTLFGAATEQSHIFRLGRFQLFFNQIEEWVEREDTGAHIHEIELDMNDMKAYLQDFLAALQRANREKSEDPSLNETIQKLHHHLLEYRYRFGQFFFTIMSKNREGKLLRNQFLFVDQYFESAENALNEIKSEDQPLSN